MGPRRSTGAGPASARRALSCPAEPSVEHPRLARLSAAAATPTAVVEVRGLYKAICEAGIVELRTVLEEGAREGTLKSSDLDIATRFVATVIGPGLTDVILQELGAELHEVLASDSLRKRLNLKRRRALAREAVLFIRNGLGSERKTA